MTLRFRLGGAILPYCGGIICATNTRKERLRALPWDLSTVLKQGAGAPVLGAEIRFSPGTAPSSRPLSASPLMSRMQRTGAVCSTRA